MLRGTYTALITPFNDDLSIDWKGYETLLNFQISSGVDGIMILGTTGEAPTLNKEEEEELIKKAVEICKGQTTLFVGTGSYNTLECIKRTQKAKNLGADGALIVTPYYNKPTQEGLYQHFKLVAEKTKFPILVYNIQGRTGQNLETDTLKRFMDIPEIIGVKEASGNIVQMMDVIQSVKPDFSVLSGDDNLTYPLIALGGHGIVSVLSNLLPKEVVEMTHLALEGQFEKARALHYELLPWCKALFVETNPAPVKYLMSRKGLPAGKIRLPLVPVKPETEQKLNSLWSYETATLQN